jgi:hypothetical protein
MTPKEPKTNNESYYQQCHYLGFEVFTAVVMKSVIFWDMTLLATCLLAGLLNYSSTLKMEAIRSSETSGATQRTTRRHIPEDGTLQCHYCFGD